MKTQLVRFALVDSTQDKDLISCGKFCGSVDGKYVWNPDITASYRFTSKQEARDFIVKNGLMNSFGTSFDIKEFNITVEDVSDCLTKKK